MEQKIIKIVSSITKVSEDELANNINKEGFWDSLKKVEIIIALEDEFDITFTQEEIAGMKTISNINDCLAGKL